MLRSRHQNILLRLTFTPHAQIATNAPPLYVVAAFTRLQLYALEPFRVQEQGQTARKPDSKKELDTINKRSRISRALIFYPAEQNYRL